MGILYGIIFKVLKLWLVLHSITVHIFTISLKNVSNDKLKNFSKQ